MKQQSEGYLVLSHCLSIAPPLPTLWSVLVPPLPPNRPLDQGSPSTNLKIEGPSKDRPFISPWTRGCSSGSHEQWTPTDPGPGAGHRRNHDAISSTKPCSGKLGSYTKPSRAMEPWVESRLAPDGGLVWCVRLILEATICPSSCRETE
ncbi:hypothetical protein BDW69DRAFT_51909 [Aspergillus filifer]